MKNRKFWFVGALSLLFLCFMALVSSMERLVTSFPDFLLGQVYLVRENNPPSPRDYQSAEFVLKEVQIAEVEQAFYIDIQQDVLFAEPHYTGFPRTELSTREIRLLQDWLVSGNLFYQTPDGNAYQCITKDPMGDPKLETCAQGKQYMDQFVDAQWDAEQNHLVGVLQFFLTGERLADIRVYRSNLSVAYVPLEKEGDWWLNGLTVPLPLLDQISNRLLPAPVLVLWPEKTATQANARAARIIGDRYQVAVDLIQNSSAVREVFGDIQEIRPAAGVNSYSSWMDSTSVFLTFRVLGARGEGVVIAHGYDCFEIQMVFEGKPQDDVLSSICP